MIIGQEIVFMNAKKDYNGYRPGKYFDQNYKSKKELLCTNVEKDFGRTKGEGWSTAN